MHRRLLRAGIVLPALALCGCTAIGYGIGKAIEKDAAKTRPIQQKDLITLGHGEPLQLQLWDGTKTSGVFRGLQWTPAATYAAAYDVARAGPAPGLPRLGPGATLVKTSRKSVRGEYVGLGPGFVAFSPVGGRLEAFDVEQLLALTDASGGRIESQQVRLLLEQRKVPLVTAIALEQPGGRKLVDSGDVASVTRLGRHSEATKTGTIVGAVLDVAAVTLVVIAAASMSSGWDSSDSTTTSCPLVDSFDGTAWRLDAEPLGGAFYGAAERTDLARLDHAEEVAGEYRLRLRNDQQEIDHVDALSLRVVDHDPGAELVPDARGGLLALDRGVAPATGRPLPAARVERRDADVAAALARSDDRLWVSDAWGREPSVAGHLRDGVELEYPRPSGAGAVLVVRAGATAHGGRLLRRVLELHGRDLPAFYARLGRDRSARAVFEAAREREVLPTVRLWDGAGWRTAGFLRDLPSLARRDQAVPLDLRGIDGGTVRVRIDGPPGLWSLDRAVLAREAPGGVADSVSVPPSRALLEDGTDVTARLARRDGRRHSLRPRMDTVILRFPAPPREPGLARTVLVEATGYYNVIVGTDGEPRREAFRRLVEEPGAVARFALEGMRVRPVGEVGS